MHWMPAYADRTHIATRVFDRIATDHASPHPTQAIPGHTSVIRMAPPTPQPAVTPVCVCAPSALIPCP